jgi:hypothetical protein
MAEGKNVDPGNPGGLTDGGTTRRAHGLAVYDLIYIAFSGHGNGCRYSFQAQISSRIAVCQLNL